MQIHLFHNYKFWLPWLLVGMILACNLPIPQKSAPMDAPIPVWSTPYPTYTTYPTYTALLTATDTATAPAQKPYAVQPTATKKPRKPTRTFTPDTGLLIVDHIEVMKVSDIEVLKVNADSSGGVSIDIRNNGPAEFHGQVRVVCIAMGYMRGDPQNQIPFANDESIHINISIGTGFFPTSLKLNTAAYSYPSIHCTVGVPDDPNPNNNAGATVLP